MKLKYVHKLPFISNNNKNQAIRRGLQTVIILIQVTRDESNDLPQIKQKCIQYLHVPNIHTAKYRKQKQHLLHNTCMMRYKIYFKLRR